MKLSRLSKVVATSTFALSLAVLSTVLPASAQTNDTPGSNDTPDTTIDNTTGTDTNYEAANDDGFDWGWLGLIGLAGLAGLTGRKEQPARYRDPSEGTTTTTRY